MDVGVDEAGQERAAPAVDEEGFTLEGEGVGVGGDGGNAPVLDDDGLGARAGSVESDDVGVVEDGSSCRVDSSRQRRGQSTESGRT